MKNFLIVFVVIFVIMGIFSFFGSKNNSAEELVRNSTVGDCMISVESKGSRVYNDEEAICYIFKYLGGKDVTKDEIKNVVQLENKYRDSNPPVEPGNDPVPAYIYQNQTMNLTQEKIDRIYDAESYYLQFIGVM